MHSIEIHTVRTTLQPPILALYYDKHLAVRWVEKYNNDGVGVGDKDMGRYVYIKSNNFR